MVEAQKKYQQQNQEPGKEEKVYPGMAIPSQKERQNVKGSSGVSEDVQRSQEIGGIGKGKRQESSQEKK